MVTSPGCSDGDDRDAATTTTAPSPTTSTAPMTDQQRAESIVLQEADVGAGFKAADSSDEEADARSLLHFDDCAPGTLLATEDESRSAESDLAKDQNTSVLTVVSLATDAGAMQPAFDRVSSDRFLECFGQQDKTLAGAVAKTDGGTLSDWTIEKKTVEAAGAEAFAIEAVAVVTGGFKATWHHEAVFLRTGRVLTALVFFTDGAPYPQAEKDRLVTLTVDRMTAAAA